MVCQSIHHRTRAADCLDISLRRWHSKQVELTVIQPCGMPCVKGETPGTAWWSCRCCGEQGEGCVCDFRLDGKIVNTTTMYGEIDRRSVAKCVLDCLISPGYAATWSHYASPGQSWLPSPSPCAAAPPPPPLHAPIRFARVSYPHCQRPTRNIPSAELCGWNRAPRSSRSLHLVMSTFQDHGFLQLRR